MVLQAKINKKIVCVFLLFIACFQARLYGSKSFAYPSSVSSGRSSYTAPVTYRSAYHHHNNRPYVANRTPSDLTTDLTVIIVLMLLFACCMLWIFYQDDLRQWYRRKYLHVQKGDQQKVYKDYDRVAEWFDTHRSRDGYEKKYLDKVFAHIPAGGTILDIGCGMGQPVTQYLIERGYQVTGVEGSSKLIAMARDRYPLVEFVYSDMRLIDFSRRFDAIILWHSFFHLSVADQKKMFPIFVKHLQPGGILLFTSGPDQSEVWSNNGGIDMYHASLSAQDYALLLQEYHFTVLEHVVQDLKCGDATVWIAQYLPSLLLL